MKLDQDVERDGKIGLHEIDDQTVEPFTFLNQAFKLSK